MNARPLLLVAALVATPAFPGDAIQQLNALTDRMAAQAQATRDTALVAPGRVLVPTNSPYLGQQLADPTKLLMYRSQGFVQFSDGFKAHTVHDAVDKTGTRRMVVVAHGITRGDDTGWKIVKDDPVKPAPGSAFAGSDAGKMGCTVNGNPALAFGYFSTVKGGYEADGQRTVAYELDPYSNPIPMVGVRAVCRKS